MISIIVPVYNTREYVGKCIESILNQSYEDFELILIDDGSTDDSLEVCESYQVMDKRIKVFNKTNGGQGSARNLGLSVAEGEYLTFVDSDDWILPDLLQILYNNMISSEADISCCTVFSKEDASDKKNENNLIIKENIEAMNAFVKNQGCFNHSPVAKLFKRHTFVDVNFIELRGFEDAGTIFKAFINARRVVAQNISLYYYYQRVNSTMHRPFSKDDFDRVLAYEEMEKGLMTHSEYYDAAAVVTSAKIGAIYYVTGECIRKQVDGSNEILSRCKQVAKKTLKNKSNISLKNKIVLRILLFNPKVFGFFYDISH